MAYHALTVNANVQRAVAEAFGAVDNLLQMPVVESFALRHAVQFAWILSWRNSETTFGDQRIEHLDLVRMRTRAYLACKVSS